jgi:hypothetical protein
MGNSQPIKNSQDNSRSTEKDTIGLDTFIEHVGPRKVTQYDDEVSQLTSMLEPKNKNCVIKIFPKELIVVEINDTDKDSDVLSSADATSSVLPLATSKALSSTSSEFFQSHEPDQQLIKSDQRFIKLDQPLIKSDQPLIKSDQPLIKPKPSETESSSPLVDTELIKQIREKQHGGAKKHKGIYIRSEDDDEELVVDDDYADDYADDDDDFEDDNEDKDDDIAEDIPRRNHKPVQHKSKKSPFMKHKESENSESSLKGKRNLKKNYMDYTSSESTLNKYSVSPVHTSDIQMYSEN